MPDVNKNKAFKGFTDEERAAMKVRTREQMADPRTNKNNEVGESEAPPRAQEYEANEMAKTVTTVTFKAKLFRPSGVDKDASWTFLNLPEDASRQLPSRSMASVDGTFSGFPFLATLLPDGQGGHWLKVDQKLREATGAKAGDVIELQIAPVAEEPEPEVPEDFQGALAKAPPKAMATWAAITPVARRDWIFWITSGKKAATRVKRIDVAISKLSAGSRRPCCFDRSGMYDKSLSCPIPDESK